MKKSVIFRNLLIVFCFGVGFFYLTGSSQFAIIIFLAIFLLLFLLKKAPVLFLLLFFLLGYGCSFFWENIDVGDNSLVLLYDKNKIFEAEIIDIKKSLSSIILVIKPDDYHGKFIVYEKIENDWFFGERIIVDCEIKKPVSKHLVNYDKLKQKDGILAICAKAKIERQDSVIRFSIIYKIREMARFSREKLSELLPVAEASLLSGILQGDVSELPNNDKENFSIAGLSHIVAVSGYNVNIIVSFLAVLAKRWGLSRQKMFISATVFLFFFCVFTGLSASVIRAVLMSLTLLWGQFLGKRYSATNGLFFVSGIMIFFNPLILFYDLGFQLSFMSTFGLICLSEKLTEKFSFIPEFFSLRENLATTFSAMFFSAPLIMYSFGKFSVYAPFANLAILPLIPPIMMIGAVALFFSFIFFYVAYPFALIVYFPLFFILWLAQKTAELPFASLQIKISGEILIMYYLLLIFFVFYSFKSVKNSNLCEKN